ncbi:polysaccharide deacetylase family protein [Pseudarthrobacter sp. fls2-241-R2A-127]|uniref:polysaccharide deacetylase family protein n=1 Tax=Pseudarthrobacter sp. fls2-241-R2A-127 TaxID=3040303 RepID=UPI002556C1AD|nr:polysaccharide deacetylase family protein [Pseudarthrobacter sp. fls2-241-R2A-127]
MGHGWGGTRGNATRAGLHVLLAAICAAALVSGGESMAGAPYPALNSHERVSSQPETVALPQPLSDALNGPVEVPGGYGMALTAHVGERRVHASWTYVDGVPGLNTHVDSWLLGLLDAAAPVGGRYRPAMALNAQHPEGQEMTVSAAPVQAAGTVIVVRQKVKTSGTGGTVSERSETVYVDTVSGAVRGGAELVRPEAVPGIQSRMVGIPAQIAALVRQDVPVGDLVLKPSGELAVSAEVPGNPGGNVTLTMNAAEAGAVLSDYGRQVLEQLNAAAVPRPAMAPALRHVNCDIVPCAALTYDDGPDAHTTPQLMEILNEANAQATFFMTGSNATANPSTAKEVADAGYAIGNHTYSHGNLTKLSPPAVKKEIERTDAAILAATGTAPTMMRPPYGAADAAVQGAVGKPLMLWAVDSLDWQSKNPAVFVPKVLKEITPGAMVLMHDVQPTTISGQKELIASLQGQGYRLVSVPQLFEGTPLVPGHVYRSRPARP